MAESDIYELIERDHREVEGYFRELRGSDRGQADTAFARLAEDLLRHMAAEEATFYVALEAKPQTAGLAAEGNRQHREARTLVADVTDVPGSAAWEAQVARLEQTVERHISLEEGTMFPAARQGLNERQAQVLGDAFRDERTAVG